MEGHPVMGAMADADAIEMVRFPDDESPGGVFVVAFNLAGSPLLYVNNFFSVEPYFPPQQEWWSAITIDRGKFGVAKGKAPAKVGSKTTGFEYDYSGLNPAQLTLSFAPKTGIFKGNFKIYYDYDNAKGALQHKTITVPYAGVMLQDGNKVLSWGAGHALVPDNAPENKVYKLKRSFPAFITGVE